MTVMKRMKCLTITVDDMTLFSGEVSEYQFSENPESVGISARFVPGPNLIQALQGLAAKNQQQRGAATEPDGSVPTSPPTLDVVRDDNSES